MKKYGLQLRVLPSQLKKQPTRPPVPPPLVFSDENEDDIEREIYRQASKNKTLEDIEEQHTKALEEDPTVFDYDIIYEEMKEKTIHPLAQDREERKPKYIQKLIEKAKDSENMRLYMKESLLGREAKTIPHIQTKTNLSEVLTKRNLQSRQNGWRKNGCVNYEKRKTMS